MTTITREFLQHFLILLRAHFGNFMPLRSLIGNIKEASLNERKKNIVIIVDGSIIHPNIMLDNSPTCDNRYTHARHPSTNGSLSRRVSPNDSVMILHDQSPRSEHAQKWSPFLVDLWLFIYVMTSNFLHSGSWLTYLNDDLNTIVLILCLRWSLIVI